jgi:type I restriction enzyme S subunit
MTGPEANWTAFRLGEVCQKIGSGSTPRGGGGVYATTGVAFIRSQNVLNSGFSSDGLTYLSDALAFELRNVEVAADDVLVNITGDSVARVCQVPASVLPARVNQHVAIVRPDPERLDPAFLRYYLIQSTVQEELLGLASAGATRNALTKAMLERVSVLAPQDVQQQRVVSGMLVLLDSKIELNRCMSQTLQAIAQAIFKSWFVDFDPLRALAEGMDRAEVGYRFGLPLDALHHFASDLIDANGQMIPTGWPLSTLGREVKSYGGLLQTGPFGSQLHASDYADEGIPVVMPQDMVDRRVSTNRIARIPRETADGLKRHMLRTGDVVYSRRGDVERHARVTAREEGWLCGTGCLLVRMGGQWPSPAYLSEVLNDQSTREWIVRHAVGATMPNLNTSILSAVPLLVPPAPLLLHFEQQVGPLVAQQEALNAEADTLAATRDELLPRLLSGKLAVG